MPTSASAVWQHKNHRKNSATTSRAHPLCHQVSDAGAVIGIGSYALAAMSGLIQLTMFDLTQITVLNLIRLTVFDLILITASDFI